MSKHGVTLVTALAVALVASSAQANPRPLPFTYNYETLGQGEGEVEQYVDLVPVKGTNAGTGGATWYTATQFQTEFEYGLTDRLELGLYAEFQPYPANIANPVILTEGTGIKERLKYRFGDEGELPIDMAVYCELVQTETEFEIEEKLILQKRFGNLRIAANAWAEEEIYYGQNQQDMVINPTAGLTYQFSPMFHAGLEWWMRKEWTNAAGANNASFNLGYHNYVGPALMGDFGRIWWSAGIYARVDDVNYTMQAGDLYGPIWVRSIIGVNL